MRVILVDEQDIHVNNIEPRTNFSFSVGRWADKLGTELWELANEVGRPEELLEVSMYTYEEARKNTCRRNLRRCFYGDAGIGLEMPILLG